MQVGYNNIVVLYYSFFFFTFLFYRLVYFFSYYIIVQVIVVILVCRRRHRLLGTVFFPFVFLSIYPLRDYNVTCRAACRAFLIEIWTGLVPETLVRVGSRIVHLSSSRWSIIVHAAAQPWIIFVFFQHRSIVTLHRPCVHSAIGGAGQLQRFLLPTVRRWNVFIPPPLM